ncbi:MAG TPA: S8 family serine peptidase [Acidimicrobiia bacterium]|nr:S8 family serine peptidase [Acidimicrobiia bacterium]
MGRRLAALAISVGLVMAFVPAAGAAPPLERVIVVLHPGPAVEEVAQQIAAASGGIVGFVYRYALRGFALSVPAAAVEGLRQNPNVAWVEPDVLVHAAQTGSQPVPTGIDRVDADLNPPVSPMDVDIAIIDTGIYIGQVAGGGSRSHYDLNLVAVTDCTSAIFYPTFGGCDGNGNTQDQNGHGTHVAGIAAALDNDIGSIGTAPGARLWSIKVLDASGSGYLGGILAGIDLVTSYGGQIEAANMSFGFEGASAALDTAIANATNAGVVMVAAAGNSGKDTSTFSPANHPDVISVSALADFDGLPGGLGSPTCRADQDDTLADFSNFGADVEIAAPGVCIYSTYLNDGYATLSGTSMAAPFVTGAVARYIAQSGYDPANRTQVLELRSRLVGSAAPQNSACGFTGDPDSYAEPLLFLNASLFGGNGLCNEASSSNQPPVASFTSSCADLSCAFTDTSTDGDGTVVAWSWNFGDSGISSEQNPSHTFPAGGTYQVTLTATDNEGAVDSQTSAVTVTANAPAPTMSATITSLTTRTRGATATVSVIDDDSNPVPGATVAGRWTFTNKKGQAVTRNRTATTASTGSATFNESLPAGYSNLVFCVMNVTKSGYLYSGTLPVCWPPG